MIDACSWGPLALAATCGLLIGALSAAFLVLRLARTRVMLIELQRSLRPNGADDPVRKP